MNIFSKWITNNLGLDDRTQWNLLLTAILLVAIYFLRMFILQMVFRRFTNPKDRYIWRNSVGYTFVVLNILVVSIIWIDGLGEFTKFLGFISAGLVIALRDPIVNFVGWIYIVTTTPFEVGDRIKLGDVAGDIIDIKPFHIILNEIGQWVAADQATGRLVYIPNKQVFDKEQINYSIGFPFIWNEIHIVLTFESDWRKAKNLFYNIIEKKTDKLSPVAKQELLKASKRYMIHYPNLNPKIYTKVVGEGVQLSMRYLVKPRSRRSSEEGIWELILDEVNTPSNNIELAYKTTRVYFRQEEGKENDLAKDRNTKH